MSVQSCKNQKRSKQELKTTEKTFQIQGLIFKIFFNTNLTFSVNLGNTYNKILKLHTFGVKTQLDTNF